MQQKYISYIMRTVLLSAVLFCGTKELVSNPIDAACQMIVALADDWESTIGYLQCFQRVTCQQPWVAVGEKIPVSFGKKGLGWGVGLHDEFLRDNALFASGPRIVEGARKSPVGVFALHTAFGKAAATGQDVKDVQLPYTQITQHVWGVDDTKSAYYNRIVDAQTVAKDWDSAEDMLDYANQGLYEFGAFIEHNYEKPIPGKGSCFFIHVHRTPGGPTWGCTAFAREQVQAVISWLDPDKKPVLAQFPRAVFDALKDVWKMPEF